MKKDASYHRISWTIRQQIEALYNAGHSHRFIAAQLGNANSAIYNELQHGLYEHMGAETKKRPIRYSAQIAQDYTDQQATARCPAVKLGHHYDYAKYVAEQVALGFSLDSIVGRLKKDGKWTVSTSTLYRYVACGYIPGVTNADLPEKPFRKEKHHNVRKAARPPKGTSIEQRPDEINDRTSFANWEMDSVIGKAKGKRESILTLTERLTRYEIIVRVPGKTSAATVKALNRLIPKFPAGTFNSITVDNGSEFQDCHGMEHDKKGRKRTQLYYCHPYTSCERGSNECANRNVRRDFPKGKSMKKVTQRDCDRAAARMNAMPRKMLGYATAAELFDQHIRALAHRNTERDPQGVPGGPV